MSSSQCEPITLTYDQAKAELEAIVAEKGGDYIYEAPPDYGQCVYFVNNQPSCIVGHVLAKHGVDEATLGNDNYSTAAGLLDSGYLKVDEATHKLLTQVQDNQDGGTSWGDSLTYAISEAEPYAVAHQDYPHEPGSLIGCPGCEARCHCVDMTNAKCVFEGEHGGQ